MKSTSNGKAASDDRSGLFFWSDEILTDAIELVESLRELVKAEAREDENPWRNIHFHAYEFLAGAKIYLRRQLLDKHWMQNKLH